MPPSKRSVRHRTGDASYELLSHLASGGMAELFLARRTDAAPDAAPVVLKRILPVHAGNQDFVSMFLDEARLASRLNHPNIARVLEVGRIEDTYFYTMEYVRGKNLREILTQAAVRRARIPLEIAVHVIASAATGLHAAHEQRDLRGQPLEIVHRDVSPSNVMIGEDGTVKIVDFGVAKASDRMTETRSGTIKGKTAYLSPEQCRVRPVDRRSDVFSLGIVAWELIAQARLFRHDNDFDTMDAILRGRIAPPSEIVDGVPRAIDAAVLRALERDPAQRFATAAEMATALVTALGRPIPADASARLADFLLDLFGVFGDRTDRTAAPAPILGDPSFVHSLGALAVSVIDGDDDEPSVPEPPPSSGPHSGSDLVPTNPRRKPAKLVTAPGVPPPAVRAEPRGAPVVPSRVTPPPEPSPVTPTPVLQASVVVSLAGAEEGAPAEGTLSSAAIVQLPADPRPPPPRRNGMRVAIALAAVVAGTAFAILARGGSGGNDDALAAPGTPADAGAALAPAVDAAAVVAAATTTTAAPIDAASVAVAVDAAAGDDDAAASDQVAAIDESTIELDEPAAAPAPVDRPPAPAPDGRREVAAPARVPAPAADRPRVDAGVKGAPAAPAGRGLTAAEIVLSAGRGRQWAKAFPQCGAALVERPSDGDLRQICAKAACMSDHLDEAKAFGRRLPLKLRSEVERFCENRGHTVRICPEPSSCQ